jgi:prepilin-type N-terminal cleavage/methylation domain-containing protein
VEQVRMPILQVPILRRIKGFTFIELALVILLLGILFTFASVNWGLFPRKDTETFLERLSIEVALLREDAISTYQQREIEIDITNNTLSMGAPDLIKGFDPFRKMTIPQEQVIKDTIINGTKNSIGKRYVRLYPSGLVDKTILHIEGRKEGFYSITIHPLTAKVEAQNGYIEEISLSEGGNTP